MYIDACSYSIPPVESGETISKKEKKKRKRKSEEEENGEAEDERKEEKKRKKQKTTYVFFEFEILGHFIAPSRLELENFLMQS